MDITPTAPNALIAQPPQPQPSGPIAMRDAAEKSTATDFRQILAAAKPVGTDAAAAATGDTTLIPAMPVAAATAGKLPMTAKISATFAAAGAGAGPLLSDATDPMPSEAAKSPPPNAATLPSSGGTDILDEGKLLPPDTAKAVPPDAAKPLASADTKRARKPVAPRAATASNVAAAAPLSLAPAAQATVLVPAPAPANIAAPVPAPHAMGVSGAIAPQAAQQAAPSDAGPAKRNPALSANIATRAAPAAPAALPAGPAVAANSAPGAAPSAAPQTVPATHALAKAADVAQQIAAALARGNTANPAHGGLSNATPNPALHISLTPETLGTITIKVAQHASGDTTVTLTASQPETLAALKHDAANLNQILTNAGVPEANRQVNFQSMPVVATQTSAGLGNAGGQPAGGQPAGGQTLGQAGQGNPNAQQQQQNGTAFASSTLRPSAASVATTVTRLGSNHPRNGVDVIA